MMPHAPSRSIRRIVVLGSTGSIGTNTLRVIEHLNQTGSVDYRIVGLATGSNFDILKDQAAQHNVRDLAIAHPPTDSAAPDGANWRTGPNALRDLVETVDADLIIGAVVGAAGLPAILAGIDRGIDIALANKETLVAAGEIVTRRIRETGVRLFPIDSEHSAIFQCLPPASSSASNWPMVDTSRVKRIVLTASGGPFRTWTQERIQSATVEEALDHPTWDMGAKITIDSASMANKALEIIEAHWLFDLPAEKIDVIVHPQSIVHSFVEYDDGSVLAQLGSPDMRTPIQLALTWPDRPAGISEKMDWSTLSKLDFEPPDEHRFPALRMAREVIEMGGTAGAIFNAANEEAVQAFLDGRIPFGRIATLAAEALDTMTPVPAVDLETVLAADEEARKFVIERVGARAGVSP